MVSKKFVALLKKGKINVAINLLSGNMRNRIVPLNNEALKTCTSKEH